MSFWDASAVLALLVTEPHTRAIQRSVGDEAAVVWWGTPIECISGLCRLRREAKIAPGEMQELLRALDQFVGDADEVEPSRSVRDIAANLLEVYPLRAADALQLGAALAWAECKPLGHRFVCLDRRLREAAAQEGFLVCPENL